jgi:hypothetical protein
MKPLTLKELLKPDVYTCGHCGGPLYIYPYLVNLPKRRGQKKPDQTIKSLNFCPTCSVPKQGENRP